MSSFTVFNYLKRSIDYHLSGYRATGDIWSYRLGVSHLIEIEIKILLSYYLPKEFNLSKSSHNVFGLLGLLRPHIPDLDVFMKDLGAFSNQRLLSLTSIDYDYLRNCILSESELETFPLPSPEDMHTLFRILSAHIRYEELDLEENLWRLEKKD